MSLRLARRTPSRNNIEMNVLGFRCWLSFLCRALRLQSVMRKHSCSDRKNRRQWQRLLDLAANLPILLDELQPAMRK
jgi:hypothetical protein